LDDNRDNRGRCWRRRRGRSARSHRRSRCQDMSQTTAVGGHSCNYLLIHEQCMRPKNATKYNAIVIVGVTNGDSGG